MFDEGEGDELTDLGGESVKTTTPFEFRCSPSEGRV